KLCDSGSSWIETLKKHLDGILVIERNQSNQTKLPFQVASILWLLPASTAKPLSNAVFLVLHATIHYTVSVFLAVALLIT
ncbi:hypothetical protein ACYTPF_19315, partial [Alteromonas sp. HB246098]